MIVFVDWEFASSSNPEEIKSTFSFSDISGIEMFKFFLQECKMSTFSHLDVLSLPVNRQFEKVVLSNEVSMHFEDTKRLTEGMCHV